MKILPMYGGTEWAADPCAVLVDQSYYDEYVFNVIDKDGAGTIVDLSEEQQP